MHFTGGFEIVNLDTKLCAMEEVRVSHKFPEPLYWPWHNLIAL